MPFGKHNVQVWAGREAGTHGQPHGEGGRACISGCGVRETPGEGSQCFSFREASVSTLALCLGCSLLLFMGASECCPSQESFPSGSGEAVEFWHVSHYVYMWMHTRVYASEYGC